MSNGPNALVCGYYGFGNAGDEAILAVLLDDLASIDARVTVMAGSPADLYADHGVDAIPWQDTAATIEAARRADLMILGGGGLFQDHNPFEPDAIWSPHHGDIGYWSGFALLARATDTPLAIYGVGVGPLTSEAGRRYASLAFSLAATASVRDQGSAGLLADLGVEIGRIPVTADPAFALNPASAEVADEILETTGANGDPVIGVCLRPWANGEWLPAVSRALDDLIGRLEARAVLVPFQESPHAHENDSQVALDLLALVDHPDRVTILRGGYTPAERAAVLGRCRMVLGMRLHSVIFAAAMGVPVVALAYDPKVGQVMEELGVGEFALDLRELETGLLLETAAKLDDHAAEIRPRLEKAAGVLRQRAAGNRDVLPSALARPAPPRDEIEREMTRLALLRAGEAAEIERARAQVGQIRIERDGLAGSRERLAEEYRILVGSRAMRLVNTYWKVRNDLRGLGRRRPPTESTEFQALSDLRSRFSKQLEEILEAHRNVAGVVVYPHTIGWSVSLFQRPQQMALAFARQGYLTFYNVEWMGADYINGFSKVNDRLYLFAMPDEVLDLIGAIPQPLLVSYVYNFGWRRFLRDPVTIFEHIDELEVFAATHSMEKLTGWYEDAIREADVAAASAVDLLSGLRPDRPDAILCPNGVDYRHFAGAHPVDPPVDLRDVVESGRPVVGYYGALAEWVDYGLVEHAARSLPDYEFVFIGPDYDASMAGKPAFDLPNVTWLGVKPYAELPAYLHFFDVATVPFVINEVTHSVSPIKLFEYMAGGRPAVTPALRECANYPAVLIGKDPDDYVSRLKEAVNLRHDPDHQALLRRTARANTWDRRVGTLLDAVARARKS
ncbi:MAG: polysaccharide pyruvyl transferase CsaB [Actinomycetota bacterium]